MTWMVKDKTLSDYLQGCKEAAKDLRNFKRDPRLTAIWEHTNTKLGESYFNLIRKNNRDLFNYPGMFDGEDIGNPVMEPFGHLYCSASTLQYIGVLSNIIDWCGPQNGKRIIEIGGGYGGQCQILQAYFRPETYTIIDLPEVCELQNAYLEYFNSVHESVSDIPNGKWDLVISNYALSEIKDPLQSEYVERILKNSKHGYITCNIPIPSLTWGEKMPDIKGERESNFIVTW